MHGSTPETTPPPPADPVIEASAAQEVAPVEAAAPPIGIVARLKRGGASYALATLVTRGITFLLLPVYTRFLTPSDYGLVSLSETVAASIPMVGGMGLSAALQRLYFKHDSQDERASTVATVLRGALLWLFGFLAFELLVGAPLLRLVAPHFSAPFFPYIAFALCTAACNVVIDYRQTIFQNQERARAYAVIAVGAFLLTAICALVLVLVLHMGAKGMLLGKLIGASSFAALALVLLRPHLRGRWNGGRMREAVAIGAPLVPHSFIALILGSADVLVIQAYRSVAEVGLYSVAYALGASILVVTSTLMTTWSPVFYDVARNADRNRESLAQTSMLLTTVMIGAGTIGTALVGDAVALMLHERFRASASLAPIIIGGYVFQWLFSMFHLALIQVGRSYLIAATTFFAAALNMVLNFALIPTWGAYGAAIATLVAYMVESTAMYFMAQRFFPIPYPLRRIFLALGAYTTVMVSTQLRIDPNWRRLLTFGLAGGTLALLYALAKAARKRT